MAHIHIENFNQISLFDADITDLMVFIGPQASGKSTLSKLIYFFKAIPQEVVMNLFGKLSNKGDQDYLDGLLDALRKKFERIFITHTFSKKFRIDYHFHENAIITISIQDSPGITISLSTPLRKSLESTSEIIKPSIKTINEHEISDTNSSERTDISSFGQRIMIRQIVEDAFKDYCQPLFIPAGRSIVSFIPDITALRTYEEITHKKALFLDLVMSQFFFSTANIRDYFETEYSLRTEVKENSSSNAIQELIADKIRKIIKGDYEANDNGDCIYYSPNEWITLLAASSGQQESIWILLAIYFNFIEINFQRTFSVIEEPEAHLFPDAQRDIAELLVLFSNLENNQMIITTHSPYILTSLNNLIYAFQVGLKKPKEVQKIIDKNYWLNPKKVSVYFLDPNAPVFARSIMDSELNLIKAEEIDAISSKLNDIFDKLEDIENS